VFADPVSGSIKWREIETMLIALGAEMSVGSGVAGKIHHNWPDLVSPPPASVA
jgi:hypothetical protein